MIKCYINPSDYEHISRIGNINFNVFLKNDVLFKQDKRIPIGKSWIYDGSGIFVMDVYPKMDFDFLKPFRKT